MNIYYCTEDELSKAVAERLIQEFCPVGIYKQELGLAYGGFGKIKANFRKYVNLAKSSPVLIITDLDRAECPPTLKKVWLRASKITEPLPDKMLFCIAQTEIESWLLADSLGITKLLNISQAKLNHNIETSVIDAKEYLVSLARMSNNAEVRHQLTPEPRSRASTGIEYNFRLKSFVTHEWNPREAANNSASLHRAISKLTHLHP